MEAIRDTLANREAVEHAIGRHGWCAEHNFWHFQYNTDKDEESYLFRFEDDMGILASHCEKTNIWTMFSEVLAPESKRLGLLLAFLDYVLREKKAKKVVVELESAFRQDVLRAIKGKYRACKPTMTLVWPVFDMAQWNPSLPGKDWKKQRNHLNTFYRQHTVKAVPSADLPSKQLRAILNAWKKNRPKTDRTYSSHYLNAIKANFEGFDMTRTLLIDGEPCSITGGWRIPNSDTYYSAFGLHNYKYDRLGEVTNIDDLNELKRRGHATVDFGGSEGGLLEFKKKFRPHRFYETVTFSIRLP